VLVYIHNIFVNLPAATILVEEHY